jgi:hypothetical protein
MSWFDRARRRCRSAAHARRARAGGGQEQGARKHQDARSPLHPLSSVYAAALVELNAMGEPALVCEPGYMPIT